ncbi:MAG TPA: UDP-N-acetylmuramoyl-L-alanine--D-glutamate ligase [Chlamydiales bacterium]|jgi:UDP-N-acetylmuramoylalanine--D-glutamate ligase
MPKKALIIGFGVSGKASAALLQKQGWDVIAIDRNAPAMQGQSVLVFDENASLDLTSFSLVVISPGIPSTHKWILAALEKKIEVIGEIELAFRYTENRCIGVTGTNGKTTTTLLIEHVLNASGLPARSVGNIGLALSDYLLKPNLQEILVVELSSFQLETLAAKKLDAAVYLNLTPDHLDRYATLSDYAKAKARIQDCLKPGGRLFVSEQVARDYGDLFHPEITSVFSPGPSHAGALASQNYDAAHEAVSFFGISSSAFVEAFKSFQKPSHRIEWVSEINGVQYYDDSKGTNIDAVIHAMTLFNKPIVLIAGGVDKGASYAPWIESFRSKVRLIVAYGQAASKMERELSSFFPFVKVELFKEAVALAKKEAKRGEVVLLSPGCSSFDQHRNYAHRGDEFKQMVMR